jgi:hypothetical protein
VWLQVETAVVDGLDRTATFLVAVPFDVDLYPRAWGFWNLSDGAKWIGPRHTNFTDGSVCAFVPDSGTWRPGDRLDFLLDLYTVWALRHLHLEHFGRWPGGQYSPHPFYTLIEFKPDELCNCDRHDPPRRYRDCCRPEHIRHPLAAMKADFERAMGCRITDRNPPRHVIDAIEGRSAPRSVAETLAIPAVINQAIRG